MSLSIDAPTPPPVPTVWAYSDPSSDAAFSPVVWLPLTFLLTACLLFISLRRAHALRLYADAQDWSVRATDKVPMDILESYTTTRQIGSDKCILSAAPSF
ncbi:BZ3500_MvSof-1268-A1-R1_Chr3-1g05646 [Microbotryum saponariae]|uniref:BZ3500_MvSof-1268-A1-R1_Chr3-1g05646 protein n=1 Tax=Microbotryum saponariae TaxID=289078 RepID=A0A2X0NGZ9_9BASI|nr:BZ3500_MvSof-1268-A1-R1_Chr3-1g05646 [Microbotryum saponariae]SDA04836.1 BZ3501_MvSof-1269-A2-R1_Chr3-1g05316 [Microbotryum saponariae]